MADVVGRVGADGYNIMNARGNIGGHVLVTPDASPGIHHDAKTANDRALTVIRASGEGDAQKETATNTSEQNL